MKRKSKPLRRLSQNRCAVGQRQSLAAVGSLPELLRAFRRATGWELRYTPGAQTPKVSSGSLSKHKVDNGIAVGSESSGAAGCVWSTPVSPGIGATPGLLALAPLDSEPDKKSRQAPGATTGRQDCRGSGRKDLHAAGRQRRTAPSQDRLELGAAKELASAIAGMLNELLDARRALWQREAELAARIPFVPHPDEPAHLAVRLEAALRAGAEAVGAQAAAVYLLDDATTELKLRACWGLPFDRLTATARPLRGALADLEALLGHAVVLDDPQAMCHWRAPEDFPAAVCLPVSTATNLLGTMWVFSDKKRDFTTTQTNILEIVAGRVAVDLEREVLLHENLQLRTVKRQLAAAGRLRRKLLPAVAPLIEGWQIAGRSSAAPAMLYDWFCPTDNHLAFALVEAGDAGIPGAISAASIRAMVRAHLQYHRDVQTAISRINLTHWTGSAGDQHAALLLGLIDTASGTLSAALAGDGGLLHFSGGRCHAPLEPAKKLGEGPRLQCQSCRLELRPGDVLLAVVPGLRGAADAHGKSQQADRLADVLSGGLDLPARQLAAMAQKCFRQQTSVSGRSEQALVVIKRTGVWSH